MDLRQIMYFMLVYEEASFTKAARKAGVVQPALSMQVRRLEEEFGGQLFSRLPTGVVPTALGKSFYNLCRPIQVGIAEARNRMRELQQPGQIFGTVRCGFPPSYFKALLGTVLADFSERHPGVELAVREAYGGTLRDWVAAGELDFAFGTSSQHETGLAIAAVIEEELAMVSGAPIAGATLRPCDLGTIEKLKLMLPSSEHVLGPILREHIATGVIRPQRTMIVDSYLGVLEIARVSDWAALIPITGLLEEVFNPNLYIYPIGRPFLTFRWHVLHAQSRPLTAAARVLLDAVVAGLAAKRVQWQQLCRERRARGRKRGIAAAAARKVTARKEQRRRRKSR